MRRALLTLLLAACSSGVRADFEAICSAHVLSGAFVHRAPCDRSDAVGRWLEPRIRTREAQEELRGALKMMEPAARKAAIVDAAARHGVSPCPIEIEEWYGCF
jgi:hypothetical protein